ncbi:MAG: S41 family peptidase [Patescibacteria group bacterium]
MKFWSFLPKVNLFALRKLLVAFVLAVLIFAGGYYLGVQGYRVNAKKFPKVTIDRQAPIDKSELDFSLFWNVWDTLSAKYFDKTKLNPAQMVYGAIEGMVSSLGDPYTVFLPPSENKVIQEDLNGSFEGVGIQIGFRGTQLSVIAPLAGSPAEKAGVKAGDFIISIKDEGKGVDRGTVGISLPEAVQIIRGRAGTKVTLTLLREGEENPIVVTLVREKLEIPSLIVSYVGEGNGIVHLRVLKFGGETGNEWDKTVKEILKKPEVRAVILDLRSNPGGYLQGAVDVASEFLKVGSVVVTEERSDGSKNEYQVERIGLLTNTPVAILIDGGSASASEILAGALRDAKQVLLIGDKTFGKGTIQEPLQLKGGSGLHITVARWLTPSGYWVNEKGLEPDIKIEDNPDTRQDEQLEKAIEVLENEKGQ